MHHLYLVLPAAIFKQFDTNEDGMLDKVEMTNLLEADGGSWRYLFESVYHTIESDLGDALRQHTSAQCWWRCSADALRPSTTHFS